MKYKDFLIGFVFGTGIFALGSWFGLNETPGSAYAQESSLPVQTVTNSRYTLATGPYGDDSFYAVKLDQQTGEALVLTGKKGATDDEWIILPVKDKRK